MPWCSPHKLIHSRDDEEADEGRRKYEDLNGLAIQLVKPGGLFVSCSCSGLIGDEEFERLVINGKGRCVRWGAGYSITEHKLLSDAVK